MIKPLIKKDFSAKDLTFNKAKFVCEKHSLLFFSLSQTVADGKLISNMRNLQIYLSRFCSLYYKIGM